MHAVSLSSVQRRYNSVYHTGPNLGQRAGHSAAGSSNMAASAELLGYGSNIDHR